MIPTRNNTHATEAVARLTSMFKGRPIIEGMIKAYVNRLQTLEGAIWDVILQRNLSSDNDAILNFLGAIVGETRKGRSNAEYKVAIGLRILINRSQGTRPQLLKIISIAANGNYWKYWDAYPAGIIILFAGSTAALASLTTAVKEAKAGGIGGGLMYAPVANEFLFIPQTTVGFVLDPNLQPRGPTWKDGDGLPTSVPVHVNLIYFT